MLFVLCVWGVHLCNTRQILCLVVSQHPLFRGHLIYNLWRDWYFLCVCACTAGNVSLCIQVLMCFWVRLREDRGVKMTINGKCHLHKHLSSIFDKWKKKHIFSKNNCSVSHLYVFYKQNRKGQISLWVSIKRHSNRENWCNELFFCWREKSFLPRWQIFSCSVCLLQAQRILMTCELWRLLINVVVKCAAAVTGLDWIAPSHPYLKPPHLIQQTPSVHQKHSA